MYEPKNLLSKLTRDQWTLVSVTVLVLEYIRVHSNIVYMTLRP